MASKKKSGKSVSAYFEQFSERATRAAGSTGAFLSAFAIVLIWAVSGPLFNFSETWQLVINTGTTIITFLMVFLIQKAQNKDSLALQLKLNELLASNELASNRIVDVEDLSEDEIKFLKKFYQKLADKTEQQGGKLQESHSIAEMEKNVKRKQSAKKKKAAKKRA